MASSSQLRCVIAAGGTAGHVLPSLAIADALRSRGVSVSFAGSPDRIEARLVPVAGREGARYRVVGRPVRPADDISAAEGRRRFDLAADRPVLLVFGGSQGAQALNDLALAAWGADGPAVLHLCGERYAEELSGR